MSFDVREKVSKSLEHLDWLKANSHLLNVQEIYRIEEIIKAKIWKVGAFDYLEKKRMFYDANYAEIKHLQNRINKTAAELKNFEANRAQKKLNLEEDLLKQNAKLLDEIYWLKTELSGLKQTQSWNDKARRR